MFLRSIALMMALTASAFAVTFPEDVVSLQRGGHYLAARNRLEALAVQTSDDATRDAFLFEAERLRRVEMDYSLTEASLLNRLRSSIPDITAEEVARWREQGLLQALLIEGQWKYFAQEARNVFRRSPEARRRRGDTETSRQQMSSTPERQELEAHIMRAIAEGASAENGLCGPIRRRITFRISVKPDQVPTGETVRCWMLYPREQPNHTGITMLHSTPEQHLIAPPDAPQRTVYLEQLAAAAGTSTEFAVQYEYTAWASYRKIDSATIQPYDVSEELYQQYTAEAPPHIVFTPMIRALADAIVGDETNPYLKAQRIFGWMDENIKWISEREYSTIPNISSLCMERSAGDCGVQALFFITLCRAAGVPARWESGWYPQPSGDTMHDWTRFHVEPYGWLWADTAKGYYPSFTTEASQHFYFGNIDAYRLVANADYSQPLTPPKQHFRSETVDFQRGEVEWRGGNLYFDQWKYEMTAQDSTPEAAVRPAG